MRVPFDQSTPVRIRRFLVGHSVRTAAQEQWGSLKNGDLLNAAQGAGFDVLLTTDKNIRYQQNLAGRTIAVVAIGRPTWPIPEDHLARVVGAVNAATPGSYTEVDFPE